MKAEVLLYEIWNYLEFSLKITLDLGNWFLPNIDFSANSHPRVVTISSLDTYDIM
jgi:hypothetical protein